VTGRTETDYTDSVRPLTVEEFEQIRRLARAGCGLDLREGKEEFVNARLRRLVRNGGFRSFHQYYRSIVEDRTGVALAAMLDALTTHHTAFLRERDHFDFLTAHAQNVAKGRRVLEIWSAACSTGEEVWTSICTLNDALPQMQVQVWGTDISVNALKTAEQAVYPAEACSQLPAAWRQRYFRAENSPEAAYCVSPEVRAQARFRRHNLLENPVWAQPFAVVFCRNAMIYFDQPTQQRVMRHLETCVEPGGYLFIGHAESLARVDHSLEYVQPAIYRKPENAGRKSKA
jgi:chemotaxis protein methyltransferase CheR